MLKINNKTFVGFVAALIFSASANSALILDVTPGSSSAALNDTVNVQISLSDISAPDGLAAIHLDLFFDESVLSLTSATAGSFFSNNPGSLWADPGTFGLSNGDDVFSSATSVATGPDVLGFDFAEFGFSPSLLSGVVINLEFTAIALGDAGFSLNDVSFIDNSSNEVAFNSSIGSLTVETVYEPEAITLMGIGLFCLAALRRKNKMEK